MCICLGVKWLAKLSSMDSMSKDDEVLPCSGATRTDNNVTMFSFICLVEDSTNNH